jgi:hypothetical protein
MQIPKLSMLSRPVYHKKCKEPGCEEMFDGIGVTKYCEKHRNPKARYKTKKIVSDHSKNIYIKHSFSDDLVVERNCKICSALYRFKIEPKLYLYPGCCPRCRSSKGIV